MITGLSHITLAVSDVEESLNFYSNTLGLTVHVAWEHGAYLTAGDLWLCLSKDQPSEKTDYTHLAFSVDESHFEPFSEYLSSQGVQTWKHNSSEGQSLYILDPDGHKLEIHVGDLQSRLRHLKTDPYKNLRWI